MNREKGLFLIVLVIAVLWGGMELLNPYSYEEPQEGPPARVEVPAMKTYEAVGEGKDLLVKLVSGFGELESTVPEKGRTPFVKFSPLLPVEPAKLTPPPPLATPIILPPIEPFPPVPWYRNFRSVKLSPVAGGPEEGTDGSKIEDNGGDEDDTGAEEEDETDFEEEALAARKRWEFKPEEHDKLTLANGQDWYGTVSLTKEGKDQGLTKYHLLLPEHATLEFYFQRIDTASGRSMASANTTIEKSSITAIAFADNIENRYWSRRVRERVEDDDASALCDLGLWVMTLADEPRYDRRVGLELAVKTLEESVAAAPAEAKCLLALGEAHHRAFDFDSELRLYEARIAKRDAPSLRKRTARIFRQVGLYEREIAELDASLLLMAVDPEARLLRGEARYRLGRIAEAFEDYQWVSRQGQSDDEQKTAAVEGMARVRVAEGRPDEAERLLKDRTDPRSLVTLGAAYYALGRFTEARDAFQGAVDADPASTAAKTLLGLARAHTATDWAGVDGALALLAEARGEDPLNYYLPPLGQGFAEQRRGLPPEAGQEPRRDQFTKSVEHYETARLALPTEPYIHYILGVSYYRDGRLEEARTSLLKAYQLDYRFVDALIWAGTVSMGLGDWAKARASLERALDLEKRELRAARDNEARDVARKAVVLLHFRLGRAILLSTDLEGDERARLAVGQFQALIDIDRTFAPAWIGRAILHYRAGEVAKAKEALDTAIGYAVAGSGTKALAESNLREIITAENRRIWQDKFERPDTSTVGNGWRQTQLEGVGPRLESDKVVINGGRQGRRGDIWLYRQNRDWGAQFLRGTTSVAVTARDDVKFQFLVFTTPSGKQRADEPPRVYRAVGIERNGRGEACWVVKPSRTAQMESTVLTGEDGAPVVWPDGSVEMSVRRNEKDDSKFDIWFAGSKVKTVDGIGKTRGDSLAVGFRWSCGRGKVFRVSVALVEVEIDLDQ